MKGFKTGLEYIYELEALGLGVPGTGEGFSKGQKTKAFIKNPNTGKRLPQSTYLAWSQETVGRIYILRHKRGSSQEKRPSKR